MDLGTWTVILALCGLSLLAYSLRVLDALGTMASLLVGLAIGLAGGLEWLILMAIFTGLGVVATRIGYARKKARRVAEERGGERGVPNVLGNGLAPALAALCVPLGEAVGMPTVAAPLAFAAAVAAATADTMASELGVLAGRARMVLPPFQRARSGRNGAVSLQGQLAAALGAAAIGAAAWMLLDLPGHWAAGAATLGFLGCQFDSVLGATLERDGQRDGPLGKQQVNFLGGAIPAAAILGIFWLASA